MTPFKNLTEKEQQEKLKQYEAQRKSRQTSEMFGRLVRTPHFKPTANGDEQAIFRLAVYDHKTGKTDYHTFSAFVRKEKSDLRAFYASLQRGDSVAIEYKINGGYNNVWKLMLRKKAEKRMNVSENDLHVDTRHDVVFNVNVTFEANGDATFSYHDDATRRQTVSSIKPMENAIQIMDMDLNEMIDLNGVSPQDVIEYIENERIERITYACDESGSIEKTTIYLEDVKNDQHTDLPF